MTGFYSNVFANDQLGVYKFTGSVTSAVQPGASNPYI